jgi:hypothetical protein
VDERDLRRTLEDVAGCKTGLLWTLMPLAGVFTLIGFVEAEGPHPNRVASSIFYALAFTSAALLVFQRFERHRAPAFLSWLWAARDAVRAHEGRYGESAVSRSTELVQFDLVVCFLVLETRQRTAYYRVGTPAAMLAKGVTTLVTVVFGWWSPSGLVWTIGALVRNLGSGSRTTVEALMQSMESSHAEMGSARGG